MNWYLKVMKQYADFQGRARRQEYWMFILFNMLFAFVAIFIDGLIGFSMSGGEGLFPIGIFYTLYVLAVLIPGVAVAVRRLHDIGKSGWFYFIAFIPLIGGILLLVWLCTDSQHGPNKWGDNPKGIGNNRNIDQIGKD
ncbi:DUF805 domain-containing protein [uncultured Tenacibaculum sp.]|uniref:DUF805 domain-containing protein n=1 Tax=uncultured Tenacibaculum sp. TaxID=174713 RepID=UPI002631D6A3|nr:DUF805 domain-containing protein [uncultured Tenacibaculum sp.]